ncbi:MAG: FAD:protein FMN transferase, partial [Pseudomonadota bacterium]
RHTVVDPTIISRRTLFLAPLALAACKDRTSIIEIVGRTMGTTYTVVAIDQTGTLSRTKVQGAIDGELAKVNAQMSNWDAASEVSMFNAAKTTDDFAVSAEFAQVMAAAEEVHTLSGGQFDVTTGPLIEAWGFGARNPGDALPSDSVIEAALRASGQAKQITVGTGTLRKANSDTQIYLSAIGKGFGVDAVGNALRGLGLDNFMVEIGGDMVTAGVNPDGNPWQIGIETPDAYDRTIQRIVGISDMGLATSGDYRNYFEVDGQRYSHILDATTGRPITHKTASATVLTENAMLADAWATGMLALGSETGLELADALDMAVLFIDRADDGAGFVTRPSRAYVQVTA